jgi:N-acyl-D-amino-acid deacylase
MPTERAALIISIALVALSSLAPSGCSASKTGPDDRTDPAESFRSTIPGLMSKWSIPGGVVGLVKDEKLVYVEGFGVADKAAGSKPGPTSLFRVASLSKPVTAAAVMKLVEDGLLSLDDKPFVMLDDLRPASTPGLDPRIYDITVRDLLQHSGGWDLEASFDPMFRSVEIAQEMGVTTPAGPETVIAYMFNKPLDLAPGTKYAYSNFGYCVLGRIIERVTNKSYEEYVRESILGPMGISGMRLGKSRLSDRLAGEVIYYDYPGAPPTTSVFPGDTDPVPWPYGGFYLEAMDAHGGWVASAVDLLRFVCHVDGRPQIPDLLSPSTVELMISRPSLQEWQGSAWYYAFGWQVRPVNAEANWWHTGSLPGTSTLLVRANNGLAWAALFNSRPEDSDGFMLELDRAMWQAVNRVNEWPTADLFGSYSAGNPVR